MGSVAFKDLYAKGSFGVLHNSPCLAVGHAHFLGSFVQRSPLLHPAAELGDAASEYGAVFFSASLQAKFDMRGNAGNVHAFSYRAANVPNFMNDDLPRIEASNIGAIATRVLSAALVVHGVVYHSVSSSFSNAFS